MAIREDEFASWLKPKDALSLVDPSDDRNAKQTLLWRLQSGDVQAVAETLFNVTTQKRLNLCPVSKETWLKVSTDFISYGFWYAGNMELTLQSDHYGQGNLCRFMDVRFEPLAVHKYLSVQTKAAINLDAAGNDSSEKAKLPRIDHADLKEWRVLYERIYSGKPIDTLTHARLSARGMFPDKFVPREWIDELCKGRKTGRKKATPED